MSDSFTVIGGDSRFLYTAAFLREKGHKVNHIFYDGNGGFKIYNNVILPVPALKNGFLNAPDCPNKITAEQLFGLLPEKTTVYAGMINDKLQSLAEKRGARLYDYYRDEAMLRENALLTAKAVLVLLGQKSIEIGNGKIFILGFGRCGKALYRVLTENGGCVTVVTSKKPKCDFISFDEISERIREASLVINTVPSTVLGENELLKINKDTTLIEIAAAPYGVDFAAAKRLGINVIKAPALPGRYFPKEAGEIIAETILRR